MATDDGLPGSLLQHLLHGGSSLSGLMRLLISVLFLLIGLPHQSRPQQADLPFEDIPIAEGIPTNVQHILQDRTGYLWFATWSGLHKYDGYSFVSYKHALDDTASLFDNNLTVLYEDKAGILWIGSDFGLERFDPGRETFIHYTPNPSDTGENQSNEVWSICEDRYDALWVGSGNGLYKFDRATGEFTALRHDSTDPRSIAHNSVNAIYEDPHGSIWLGTSAGLDKLDSETGKFAHYASNYVVTSICGDEADKLWVGTTEALLEFSPKEGIFTEHRLDPAKPQDRINQICRDAVTGSLWIGTRFGLSTFSRESKTSIRYSLERISAVCSERSGTLWVGTYTGVTKLNRVRQPFTKYPIDDVACVIKSGNEGTLWIWTFHGYKKFDISKGQIVPYSFGEDSVVFCYNAGGDLLLHSRKGMLSTLDTLGKKLFWGKYSWDFMSSVSYTWKGGKGFWLGTDQGGLYFFDPNTKHMREVKNVNREIEFIYEDRSALLWIATIAGKVFCYNQADDKLIEFVPDPKTPSIISGGRPTEIHEDKKGRLWFATTGGLNRYDRSTGIFLRYTDKSGLPSDNIRGILEDDHGCLWISTNKGISKLDPETHVFKSYDASYGLELTADVFYGKGCRTRNGDMYFGGATGFTRFHPDSIEDNPYIPPVVITEFKKFDKPSPFSSEIRLPYDENFISFDFVALNYVSPERNLYAYKMEGLDEDWVYSGTRRYASYPGLEPGEYVFRVRGSNNDGVWNEAGASVSIVIYPPWWKTRWAYLLYSILAFSMLYLTWRMQVKRIRMSHEYEMSRFEAEKLHELDALKSRYFANISHEFRTPLTLILGPVKQAIETVDDDKIRSNLKVVHKNANRLLGLVDQLLDISRLESGAMRLRAAPQNTVPLLKALALSFTSYAERKKIALTFSAQEDEILAYIDKDKVEKIVTNILSNAFKFTPEGGRIDVAVTRGQGRLTFAVRDTGIGIPADKIPRIFERFYQVDGSHMRAKEGTGIGLSLAWELVELHRGSIEVESTEGKGTRFAVHFPLGKEHLKSEEMFALDETGEPSQEGGDGDLAVRLAPDVPDETICPVETIPGRAGIGATVETGKPLLLIVEDNGEMRQYIASNVNQDYGILEASDGEDGWRRAVEFMPDIVVSDVMMPGMDGFTLCHKLKTDERTSHIPVILLTAKASSQDKIEGLGTGADDYIMKPFEPAEVKARIRNLIEQRKRLHEHFRKHGLYEIEEKNITPVDQKFLQNALAVISEHMSDPAFGVESLAAKMAVSRSVLLKKIEALIGEPPGGLIRRTRLHAAAKLIERRFGNISEIALEVGFSSPSHFADCFKKQFGTRPSHYGRSPAHS